MFNVKRMKEIIADESSLIETKKKLVQFFKRRIDQIDIERYRLIQRLRNSIIYVLYPINIVSSKLN